MDIDQQDGTIRLSNGIVISPSLTRRALETLPIFGASTLEYSGNPPWTHYRVPGDVTDGKRVIVTIYFYGQVLLSVDFFVNLYPPGAIGWEHYSDGIEASIKDFHDRLLPAFVFETRERSQFPRGPIVPRLSDIQAAGHLAIPVGKSYFSSRPQKQHNYDYAVVRRPARPSRSRDSGPTCSRKKRICSKAAKQPRVRVRL
jgi:hypothetical protein